MVDKNDSISNGRPHRIYPPEAIYEIPNERGELLLIHTKYRMTDDSKTFPYSSTSQVGWVWHPDKVHCPRADDLLYGLPELLEAVAAGVEVVYWTEGEKDADTAARAGVIAVSHHQGAVHSTLAQAEWFRDYRGTVIVVADMDIAGAACALRRYRLLMKVGIPRERVRIVRPADPDGLDGKDLTDHFDEGRTIAELVPVDKRINEVAAKYVVTGATRYGSGHD